MKYYSTIIVTIFTILVSCSSEKGKSALKTLSQNHMDFPEFKKVNYCGIEFIVPTLFDKSYDQSYIVKNKAFLKKVTDLYLNFSVECFSKKEAIHFQSEFSGEIDLLNSVHDYYMEKRKKSISNNWASIKKLLPKSKYHEGVFQSIEGDTRSNGYFSTYLMATIKSHNKYYVFQLIGQRENMGYLYDDFMKIVASIK